jgi:hypothetical protein
MLVTHLPVLLVVKIHISRMHTTFDCLEMLSMNGFTGLGLRSLFFKLVVFYVQKQVVEWDCCQKLEETDCNVQIVGMYFVVNVKSHIIRASVNQQAL